MTIEVAGLSKRFGDTLAVDDLSFTVEPGRVVGFLGPNGAGKTTTLRALLGLVRPTSGAATIEGRPYGELDDPIRTVGAVLDGGMLHPGRSGRNHLRTVARAAGVPDARADELLELVGLADAANRRAGGYSLGMRQRLGLATALLGDPRVLVLDEPANGLDPQGIRWLRDFLRALAAEGRAVLVSSHVLAEVSQTADEVVVIARGRSVAQATLAELTARAGGGMRVAGPDVARLGAALRAGGAQVTDDGDSAIIVRDRSGEDIGRVIAAERAVIAELAPVGASLEDIFFELTGSRGRPVVSRTIAAELLKLRTTRTSWGVALGAIALVAVICVAVALAGDFENASDPGRDFFDIASIAQIFALVLGILVVATEFRHGTITPSLLAVPDRTRLVFAKLVAALGAGFVLCLAAGGLAAAIGLTLLSARDVETGISSGDAAELLIGGAVAGGLFAALGVGLGALVRNQVGAIIGALGWIFLVEPLLGIIPGASDAISRWFPSGAAAATGGMSAIDDPLGQLPAALLLAAYALVFAAAGAALMRRRDISV